MPIVTLITGLMLSATAAWYSIFGLIAIFAASPISIAIMGAMLEVSKLVSASWLYRNWNIAPKIIKIYLTSAVCVLMLITSMGIFGYLSKSHVEQSLISGNNELQISLLNDLLDQEQRKVSDAKRVIEQLDKSVEALTERELLRGKNGAIALRESQRSERESFTGIIETTNGRINELRAKKFELEREYLKFEAEVGPIKYIADIFGADLNTTIRIVIILLVLVFDPLAVLLLMSSNVSMANIDVKKNNIAEMGKRRGRTKQIDKAAIKHIDITKFT